MKIRQGYVSNSSSSSFILLNKEKLDKVLAIASKKIDSFDFDDYYLETTSRDTIKETFLNKAKEQTNDNCHQWLSIAVNNLWFYFERYSEALYINKKNYCSKCVHSIICTEKLEDGVECVHLYQLKNIQNARKDYERALDGMPRKWIPVELMAEFTKNMGRMFKIKTDTDGTKYLVRKNNMDDYFLEELYKFTEAINGDGTVVFDFATDCGSDEEMAIRGSGVLYRIYEELNNNYVDCMWVENS